MSGWLVMLALAAAAALVLWKIARIPRSALFPTAVALALAGAGYAWQGNPSLPSAPALALRESDSIDGAQARAHPLKTAFTREDMALNASEAMIRAHNSAGAVALLKDELKGEPNNAELWIGLGNALVAHSDGLIAPAALYAFDQAAKLSPMHPLPPMMHAVALAQAGRSAESVKMMNELLARAPKDAPWRADLKARIAALTNGR